MYPAPFISSYGVGDAREERRGEQGMNSEVVTQQVYSKPDVSCVEIVERSE